MTFLSRVVALGFAASFVSVAPAQAQVGTSDASGETVTSTAPRPDPEDQAKFDLMNQNLKKQCDDLGGTSFDLQGASVKHEPAPLGQNTEGRIGSPKMYGENSHPNGGKAYQANGVCTTTMTIEFAIPPPKP